MIGREKRMRLRLYLEEGISKSEIARRLDVSRDTIHRLIRSGQLDRVRAYRVDHRPVLRAGAAEGGQPATVFATFASFCALAIVGAPMLPELSGRVLEEA